MKINPAKYSARNKTAFTLIEIMVTLALLGLIFGLLTVNYRVMFSGTRVSAAARALGDHFALAVSRSYTTASFHTLMFDLEIGEYWIRTGTEGDEDAREVMRRSLGKGVRFANVHVGYELYEPPGTLAIEVSPLGVTSDFIINLEDSSGEEYAVSMNALVQSVTYYNEHVDYEALQEIPDEFVGM